MSFRGRTFRSRERGLKCAHVATALLCCSRARLCERACPMNGVMTVGHGACRPLPEGACPQPFGPQAYSEWGPSANEALRRRRRLSPTRAKTCSTKSSWSLMSARCFLHTPAVGPSVLTFAAIFKHVVLPELASPQHWELIFDDEGVAMVTERPPPATGEQRILFAEDLFDLEVYQRQDGGACACLVQGASQGSACGPCFAFSRKFPDATLSIHVGTLRMACKVDLAIFRWPRASGARVYLSLKSAYNVMGLSQFNGQSWLWVFSGMKRWVNLMSAFGIVDGIEFSGRCCTNTTPSKKESDSSPGGVLPWAAVSCVALLLLAHHWAHRSERQCGLRGSGHRSNAAAFEVALWTIVWHDKPWRLRLDMAQEWSDISPRPQRFLDPVNLMVASGVVDLTKGRARAAEASKDHFVRAAFEQLNICKVCDPSFFEFLSVLGDPHAKLLSGIFSQVIHAGGRLLQELIIERAQTKVPSSAAWDVTHVELEAVFDQRRRLGNFLLLYLLSCQQRCRGQQCWSLCTDKASCGGFSLQARFAVVPSNLAVIPPPAQLSGPCGRCSGRRGGGGRRRQAPGRTVSHISGLPKGVGPLLLFLVSALGSPDGLSRLSPTSVADGTGLRQAPSLDRPISL